MPGYVIHLAEARRVIDALEAHTVLSEEWKQSFLTGNLLPDTRLYEDKVISHFWDPEGGALLERAPVLDRFLGKYGHKLPDPLLLGYLMHLHLDAAYVAHYWPGVIAFYDEEGRPQKLRERIRYVYIKRMDTMVPLEDFFSVAYYYGDYTRMNDYFIGKYDLKLPDWRRIRHFDMEEVRLEDMQMICDNLNQLLREYHEGAPEPLQVFDLEDLEAFVLRTADTFIKEYGSYLPGEICT